MDAGSSIAKFKARIKAGGDRFSSQHVAFSKDKKSQFVLVIGDEGAILVYMEGATVVRRLFAPTPHPDHSKTFVDLFQQHPGAPITLLMDVIDQQYVRHTFPPVSVFSLDGLVKQRLAREFPPEDIKGALKLGREATGRRDWVYLLVSLVNTATVQQWLELITAQPNDFGGIYLLPTASANYMSALSDAVGQSLAHPALWRMLVSHHKVSGFRVVMLRDGKLVFTRLAQAMGDAMAAVHAGNIEQEIQNTLEYVKRLGFNEHDGIEVFIVAGADVRDAIDASRIKAQAVHLLSPYDVAELFGLPQAALAADRFGDVVLAGAFARLPKPPLRLVPSYIKRIDQLQQAKRALRYGSLAFAALFTLLTGLALFDAGSAWLQGSETSSQLERLTPERTGLQRQVEALGVDANRQSDIVAFFATVKPSEYTPVSVLKIVSSLRAPDVTLTEWMWEWAPSQPLQPGAPPPLPGTVPPPLRISATGTIRGSFPDNETIIRAVDAYKQRLDPEVLKRYQLEVTPQLTEGGGSGKISVALPTPGNPSANQQTVALTITMQGPIPETATPPAPAGGPQ